jgi:hypothetical protein
MKFSKIKIEALAFQARNALCQLQQMAKTDLQALEVTAEILLNHTNYINAEIVGNPNFARPLTRRCPTWPGVFTADKDLKHDLSKLLQLGADAQENYASGRQWSRSTPEVKAALQIRWCMLHDKTGPKLPKLTRTTYKQWAKAARPWLEKLYGVRFEKHPLFAEYQRRQRDATLSQDTWARKAITSKLLQAFRSIAPKA